MTIEWSAPKQTTGPVDGCHITGYRLHLSRDGGATFAEIDTAEVRDKQNLQSHTVLASNFDQAGQTDLGKSFLLYVEAVNVAGLLPSSTIAVVLADAPAGPPVFSSASQLAVDETQTTKDQIAYTIATVDGADTVATGGSPILSYSLEVDDGQGGSFRAMYGNITDSLSTFYLLKEPEMRGRVYRARYRVKNVVGWSGFSPVRQTRAASRPEAPPAAPKLTAATGTSISLALTRSEDNGGATILRHELHLDDGGLGAWEVVRYQSSPDNGAALTFVIDQALEAAAVTPITLESGKVYRVKYRAVNDVGASDFTPTTAIALASLPS